MTLLDGRKITALRRVTWNSKDSSDLRGAQIIGRVMVELEGGETRYALLVASTRERALGDRFAVFHDDGVWKAVLMPGEGT